MNATTMEKSEHCTQRLTGACFQADVFGVDGEGGAQHQTAPRLLSRARISSGDVPAAALWAAIRPLRITA